MYEVEIYGFDCDGMLYLKDTHKVSKAGDAIDLFLRITKGNISMTCISAESQEKYKELLEQFLIHKDQYLKKGIEYGLSEKYLLYLQTEAEKKNKAAVNDFLKSGDQCYPFCLG